MVNTASKAIPKPPSFPKKVPVKPFETKLPLASKNRKQLEPLQKRLSNDATEYKSFENALRSINTEKVELPRQT